MRAACHTRCAAGATTNLVRVNETLMREQQVQGEVLPNPDGTCTVRLRLADDSGPLLELSLLMPAAGQGERAAARFKQAPEQLYHQLVQLLSVPEEREETP